MSNTENSEHYRNAHERREKDEIQDMNITYRKEKSIDQGTMSGDEFELDREEKILSEAKKQLKADAMFVFVFRGTEKGVFVTQFFEGSFKKEYFCFVVKGALDELCRNCGKKTNTEIT